MRPARYRVNFIPKELRPSLVNYRTFKLVLCLTVFAVPGSYLALQPVRWQIEAELTAVSKERDSEAQSLQNKLRLHEDNKQQRSLQSIRKALSEKIYWSAVFKELSNIAPSSVWLSGLETSAGENGRTLMISGDSTSQAAIAEFLANMENSYFFRDVRIRFSEAQADVRPILYRFQFEGRIFDPKPGGNDAGP
jgi:Tfp pilus assembly protein PilN